MKKEGGRPSTWKSVVRGVLRRVEFVAVFMVMLWAWPHVPEPLATVLGVSSFLVLAYVFIRHCRAVLQAERTSHQFLT